MSKHAMMQLRDMLCKELDEIAMKGDMNAGDLQTAHMLTDTIKNIDKIEMLEGGESYAAYPRGYDYEDDKYGRDYPANYSAGRYASGRGRRYSMDDGKDKLMAQIETMMRDAEGSERMALQKAMDALRR